MELAKYRYEKDLEMWNRQNAYNTPAAQMQRYATAGINPNTVVSQGNNGNASSMPSFDAPELKPYTGFGDLGAGAAANQILGKMQLDNQVRGTESQVATNTALQNKYNAEAINTSQKTETEFWNSLHRAREYGILDEFGEDTAREQLNLIKQNQKKIQQDINESQSRISLNSQKEENLRNEFDLITARIGMTKAQSASLYQSIKESASRINLNELSAEEKRKVIDSMGNPELMSALNEREKAAAVRLKEIEKELRSALPDKTNMSVVNNLVWLIYKKFVE